MAYNAIGGFPAQQLTFNKKGKAWRKRCVDFGDQHSLLHYHLTRKSVFAMKINYDLINGKIHMNDLKMLINPYNLEASFIPDNIQHYPIINSKLEVLRGEESKRLFDFRVVVTNPTAISEIEEEKNAQVNAMLQQLLMDVDKWLYYINVNNIAVEDSFKEGNVGVATGKLAGGLNNNSSGVIDASLGNEIQQYMNVLEWISTKIGELAGISKQREGQISNRETVGGVERATLQSSLITERLFFVHDSVKKRVLECFLETAKIALRGRKKKFDYLLGDGSKQLMEIDGDEFAECDYGLVVDNSNGTMELNQKLDTLAQAALQNQLLDFSAIMKLYTTKSTSEKQRIVEASEKRKREEAQQQQQQQMQLQEQQMQQQAQQAQAQQQMQYQIHQDEMENNILVAQINAEAEKERMAIMNDDAAEDKAFEREKLSEEARQFNENLALQKKKQADDVMIKEKQIKASLKKSSSK